MRPCSLIRFFIGIFIFSAFIGNIAIFWVLMLIINFFWMSIFIPQVWWRFSVFQVLFSFSFWWVIQILLVKSWFWFILIFTMNILISWLICIILEPGLWNTFQGRKTMISCRFSFILDLGINIILHIDKLKLLIRWLMRYFVSVFLSLLIYLFTRTNLELQLSIFHTNFFIKKT